MTRPVFIPRHSAGFAIVTAVFIIVALAALAAAIVSLVRTQQTSSSLDTEGARAYQAARAGIEWGAYNSLRNGTCAGSTTFALGASLGAYSVTVICASTLHNEAGAAVNIDTITATACNQAGGCPNPAPGPRYAERQITATVAR